MIELTLSETLIGCTALFGVAGVCLLIGFGYEILARLERAEAAIGELWQ